MNEAEGNRHIARPRHREEELIKKINHREMGNLFLRLRQVLSSFENCNEISFTTSCRKLLD